eukprot:TRINITY_DN3284_c1_g2_i4.p3 TRINITY_DN3284_c1_g2~~TRINITY_DN3284_c1_g2_i4.p3  ORF type:complete len:138 (+),score=0.01 TRINITY_DN3284_c1_g2_i4:422-835(+)
MQGTCCFHHCPISRILIQQLFQLVGKRLQCESGLDLFYQFEALDQRKPLLQSLNCLHKYWEVVFYDFKLSKDLFIFKDFFGFNYCSTVVLQFLHEFLDIKKISFIIEGSFQPSSLTTNHRFGRQRNFEGSCEVALSN